MPHCPSPVTYSPVLYSSKEPLPPPFLVRLNVSLSDHFKYLACACRWWALLALQFASDHPALRLEVMYEKLYIPEARAESHGNGYSDVTSLAVMRSAGVDVDTTANLIWMELIDTIGLSCASAERPYEVCVRATDPVSRDDNCEFQPNGNKKLKLRRTPNRRRAAERAK